MSSAQPGQSVTQPATTEDVLNSLQGRWRVVYSEVDGEMTPVGDFSTIILENKSNYFSVEKNGKVLYEGRFSVNLSVTPHEIVYIYTKGADVFLGGPRSGIFQLVSDTFKTCLSAVGHRPPKDFNTFPNAEAVLSIHQRTGSEQGRALPIPRFPRGVSQW